MQDQQSGIDDEPHKFDDQMKIIQLDDVIFPYKRTPQQGHITEVILQAIKKKKDCLIESATGTGKTLCLLSSCLTAKLQNQVRRVYYLTRTHSQMDCIVKQFKELGYNKVKFALQQSKKGLCGNHEILKIAKDCNHEQFQLICAKSKITTKEEQRGQPRQVPRCLLNLNFQLKGKSEINSLYYSGPRENTSQIKKIAVTNGICPYAMQSQLSKVSQLIIMSYKYVLDDMLFHRKLLNTQMSNSVLIFDQAHNIIACAKQQSSIHMNPNLKNKARQHLLLVRKDCQLQQRSGDKDKQLMNTILCLYDIQKYINGMDLLFKCFEQAFIRLRKDKTIQQKTIMIVQTKNFAKDFDESQLANYLQYYLKNTQTINNFQKLLKYQESSSKYIDTISTTTRINSQSPSKPIKFRKNYLTTFTKLCYYMSKLIRSGEMYTNYLCAMQKKKSRNNQPYLDINLVCLSSKYAFSRLKKCGVGTMVFASGTLDHQEFYKDTGLSFLKYFQTDSNFPQQNICTFFINDYKGQKLQILSGAKSQQRQVIQIIRTISGYIPYGILVFFKSYEHMNIVKNYIESHYIKFDKKVFWQQRKKSEFEKDMAQYIKISQTRPGAIMMAICRGKLSEGYNFKDNLARAVFVVGYPLMSFQCLQYRIMQHTVKTQKELNDWYYKDAMTAVNQAVGRLIRHSEDFGCIYLIGQKLYEKKHRLPTWTKQAIMYTDKPFDQVVKHTKEFIQNKDKQGRFNCPYVDDQQNKADIAEQSESQDDSKGNQRDVKEILQQLPLKVVQQSSEDDEQMGLLAQMLQQRNKQSRARIHQQQEQVVELPVKLKKSS